MTIIAECVELDSETPTEFLYCDEPNCHEMASIGDSWFMQHHRCAPLEERASRYIADCGCVFCQAMLTLIDVDTEDQS